MSQPLLSLLGEIRAPGEWVAGFSPMPLLPRGDRHQVLVIPGLGTGDSATLPLRWRLKGLGYGVRGWGLGLNRGMRPHVVQHLMRTLHALHDASGPVSIVGWSLGGIFAREMARKAPEQVRQVISLGSPFGGSNGTNIERLVQLVTGKGFSPQDDRKRTRLLTPPPVPSTAIYSKTDGLVDWRECVECQTPLTDNIGIYSSHGGLCGHPLAHFAIADRLAQPADDWQPFHRAGWRALAYGDSRWGTL
ncbi:MAG: esterase/lipase family protein [Bradymonadia bacterium]